MVYTTKQQQAVLHCLEQRPEEALTATDLAADLREAGHPVGLATIQSCHLLCSTQIIIIKSC